MLPNPQHPSNPEPSKTGPSHPGPSISPEPPANLADGEIGSETRGGIDVNDIPLSELPPLPDVELPLLNDPMGYGYQSWAAIVASGVFYGVIAAVITTVGIVTISTYQGLGVNGFLWSLIFGLIGCTISSVVIALLLGGVVGAFCVILFWSINLSLGKSIPRRICALCAGGLTGYMSLTAIVWANGNWDEFLVMFLMILFGPVLATILMTMLVGFFIDRYGAFYDVVALSGSDSDGEVPGEFSAEMQFEDGFSASFYCSFLTANSQQVVVSGDQGFITMDDFVLPMYSAEAVWKEHCHILEIENCKWNFRRHDTHRAVHEYPGGEPNSQEVNMARRMGEIVISGKLDPLYPDLTTKTQAILDACRRSDAADGAWTDV